MTNFWNGDGRGTQGQGPLLTASVKKITDNEPSCKCFEDYSFIIVVDGCKYVD